jgi:lipopolysaccharide biosynthesis protein
MVPKILALYLPQFYPTKENEVWWGKGFTEWTNVASAKPLFKGHFQPKIPADLGFYDLRVPQVREQQAELAREAGVYGFLYWHYWFGNGRRLLADVFQEVLETGKPDFPFALAWANHSWYAKTWNKDSSDKLLMEQTYPGIDDAKSHFDFLLQAFKDSRYVKVDGKPFFFIFHPDEVPTDYLQNFRRWAKDAGFPDLYIVANVWSESCTVEEYKKKGYDAITINRMLNVLYDKYAEMSLLKQGLIRAIRLWNQLFKGIPKGAVDYSKNFHRFICPKDYLEDVLPEIFPNWDHSPRSGKTGASTIYYNSEPEAFYNHVKDALRAVRNKPEAKQILILKSWNEWGEGNYMEPDLRYGHGFIQALRKALDEFTK